MKKRILLVDDDDETATGLKKVIGDEYEVVWVKTTFEALNATKGTKFWAALIDIYLPIGDDDGISLASTLRMVDSDLKIFVYSAIEDSEEVRQKVVELGGVFVAKPISGARLKLLLAGEGPAAR